METAKVIKDCKNIKNILNTSSKKMEVVKVIRDRKTTKKPKILTNKRIEIFAKKKIVFHTQNIDETIMEL